MPSFVAGARPVANTIYWGQSPARRPHDWMQFAYSCFRRSKYINPCRLGISQILAP